MSKEKRRGRRRAARVSRCTRNPLLDGRSRQLLFLFIRQPGRRETAALNPFGQVWAGGRFVPEAQLVMPCLPGNKAYRHRGVCRRNGETHKPLFLPQAPKGPGLVFHSIPSSLSLFSSSQPSLLSYSLALSPLQSLVSISSVHSFSLYLTPFLFFGSSLVRISLISLFYQAPVRLFRLGRPLLSYLSASIRSTSKFPDATDSSL